MEPVVNRIPAPSRKLAMEWSLVLASQGIEPIIDGPESGSGWGLMVRPEQWEAAVNSIRQYQRENRGWPWQQRVLRPEIIFDWGSLAWVGLIILFHWVNSRQDLEARGIMDNAAVGRGEWWRLFTAVWMHADVGHLASNAVFGFLFLGLAMGRFGTGVGVLSAYLAGVAGNLAGAWWGGPSRLALGASGMVMGALGMLAGQTIFPWKFDRTNLGNAFTGVGGAGLLFLLNGTAPGSDILAHLGGMTAGMLAGALLAQFPTLRKRPRVNTAAALVFTAMVLLPWWLALRRPAGP